MKLRLTSILPFERIILSGSSAFTDILFEMEVYDPFEPHVRKKKTKKTYSFTAVVVCLTFVSEHVRPCNTTVE